MNNSPTISPLLPLFLLLLLAAVAVAADDLIDQTCNESSKGNPDIDFTFCVTSFKSTPASQGASLDQLGLISIILVKSNAIRTTELIKNLSGNENVDANTKKGLSDCLELYSNSISTLDMAERDYRAKRFDDANAKISLVMDSSTTCEDGFQDVEVASPLTKQNKHAFQSCAIALSMINMQPH